MKKDNQFRSSLFHMSEGDVLHMLIIDETGTPITVTLNTQYADGTNNEGAPPYTPVATAASDVLAVSFTVNWSFAENSLGYYLDVATEPNFTAFVAGYENLDVSNVDEYPVAGLTEDTNYYYRVRAYNDNGTSTSSNEIALTTETASSLMDKDGNIYTTVTIGDQTWIVENLKTTTYADDAAIANITVDGTWEVDATGAYCWYDNDAVTYADYSLFYNWHAVNNASGLVYLERDGIEEAGWRVPTKTDFDELITYLGGESVAGGKLKEIGLAHWTTPNTGATDEAGLTLLGGGFRENDGDFDFNTERGLLWSGTEYEFGLQAYYFSTFYNTTTAERPASTITQEYGLNVRLVKGTGIPDTTLVDKDGNIYTTVTIGTQIWTIENLRTTTYGDDTPIPNITGNTAWGADTTGAYCYYDNDEGTYKEDYGALYNWYAVNNASDISYLEIDGAQEVGWRVPTSADWATLISYLGGVVIAGGKLKETGTTHWLTPNTGATNETGFTALGSGAREEISFNYIKKIEGIWSSTAVDETHSNGAILAWQDANISTGSNDNWQGMSVRLVKDV